MITDVGYIIYKIAEVPVAFILSVIAAILLSLVVWFAFLYVLGGMAWTFGKELFIHIVKTKKA
jgi:hypothetical protein